MACVALAYPLLNDLVSDLWDVVDEGKWMKFNQSSERP